MIKMEEAQRILEVVVKGSPGNCRMKRAVIAGLLLAGSATAAPAADPAAGQQIFKAQCGICHSVAAGVNGIGPTLFGVVGNFLGVHDHTLELTDLPVLRALLRGVPASLLVAPDSAQARLPYDLQFTE